MQNRPPVPSNKPIPTWIVVIGLIFVIAVLIGSWGNSPAGQAAKEATRAKEAAEAPAPKPTKNPGEKAFKSQLLGYTKADDGRILVSYIMDRAERRSIQTEIKAFMRTLLDDKVEFTTVAISAHGYVTDKYGKTTTTVAYTIVIPYEEAVKVESWPFADLEAIGTVQFANATLR